MKVVIRQYKSAIGEKEAARKTLESIGLRRPGNVVVREDSAALRGQIRKIAHLVEVRADRRQQSVEVETERRAAPQQPKRERATAATGPQRHGKPIATGSES